MEAIILAGGVGIRLQNAVPDLPKPMAPVAGRPFLEILLGSLAEKGFSRAIISVGFMAEKIIQHFGEKFNGLALEYVREKLPLGTGGATKLAITKCNNDHVFVLNGDTYLDLEVPLIEAKWQSNQCPIIIGKWVDDTTRYGRLIVNKERIVSFSEKGSTGPGLINAGCYVIAKQALARFPLHKPFSFELDYLSVEIKHAKFNLFNSKGMFIDIGTPDDYRRAQLLLSTV